MAPRDEEVRMTVLLCTHNGHTANHYEEPRSSIKAASIVYLTLMRILSRTGSTIIFGQEEVRLAVIDFRFLCSQGKHQIAFHLSYFNKCDEFFLLNLKVHAAIRRP
jgi:hypothetical protein